MPKKKSTIEQVPKDADMFYVVDLPCVKGPDGELNVYPSDEQLRNVEELIKNVRTNELVHKIGCFKVIPPLDRRFRSDFPQKLLNLSHDMEFSRQQIMTAVDQGFCSEETPITIVEKQDKEKTHTIKRRKQDDKSSKYEIQDASSTEERTVPFGKFFSIAQENYDYTISDADFWKNSYSEKKIYYATGEGTLFDETLTSGNLSKLETDLNKLTHYNDSLSGIVKPWIYIGMPGSHFAIHIEDSYLYSINYVHFGGDKRWIIIPSSKAEELESLAEQCFPEDAEACKNFLLHKTTLIPPEVLRMNEMPFTTVTQKAGEYMILLPNAYHQGYNTGNNVSEAVNFSTTDWIREYHGHFKRCTCPEKKGFKLECDQLWAIKNPKIFKKLLGQKPLGVGPTENKKPAKEKKLTVLEIPEKKALVEKLLSRSDGSTKPRQDLEVQRTDRSRKCNPCPYCGCEDDQLKKHVISKHREEELVKQLLMTDNAKDASGSRKLMKQITGEGLRNFNMSEMNNNEKQFLPSRRPHESDSVNSFIYCIVCGSILKEDNRRHKCFKESDVYKNGNAQGRKLLSLLYQNYFDKNLNIEAKIVLGALSKNQSSLDIVNNDSFMIIYVNNVAQSLSTDTVILYIRTLTEILSWMQLKIPNMKISRDLFENKHFEILRDVIHQNSSSADKVHRCQKALKSFSKCFVDSRNLNEHGHPNVTTVEEFSCKVKLLKNKCSNENCILHCNEQ